MTETEQQLRQLSLAVDFLSIIHAMLVCFSSPAYPILNGWHGISFSVSLAGEGQIQWQGSLLS